MKTTWTRWLPGLIVITMLIGTLAGAADKSAAGRGLGAAVYNGDGELVRPEGFRQWVFLGAPLTPNGLNNGEAAFPEFHHVYVNPDAFAIYQRTGEFPDGTVIAKELVLLNKGDFEDGSSLAPSGRGYFADRYHGMDVMVKDSQRYAATNDWGFFNFGHHAPPYAASAEALPNEACAACHTANAHNDMVFANFYPILAELGSDHVK